MSQRVEFARAGLQLMSALHVVNNRLEPRPQPPDHAHVLIDLPYGARVTQAQLIDDLVVYRWDYPLHVTSVARRPPAVPASSAPPPAP